MASESDPDLRSKRFTRLSLVSAFLLALLWPLGSFFFWIFLGSTAYFIFLAVYYSPRPEREQRESYSRPNQKPFTAEPISEASKKKIFKVIGIIGSIFFFFLFVLMIIGFIVGDDTNQESVTDNSENEDRIALASNPSDLNALTNIGNRFYYDQQYDSAKIYYQRVLDIDPKNVVCLNNMALVFYQQKDFAQTIAWAKKCVSINPDYTDALLVLGDGYFAQKNNAEALRVYQQAYGKGVRTAELLNIMAYLYDVQNNQSEAIRLYKETLSADSSYAEVYERLAELEPTRKDWYRKKAEQWKVR